MRLGGQAKGGFYPTPPRVSERIGKLLQGNWGGIRIQERDSHIIRVLDPCCGDGEAVERTMKNVGFDRGMNYEIYGVELQKDRSDKAMERFDKVLNVDFFTSMIGNESFSMLFLNPPYDDDEEDKRVEHAFLVRATRYLVQQGILVFIIPRRRLATSAKFLSVNYTSIEVYYFPEPEQEQFDQVVLIGKKNTGQRRAETEEMLIRYAMSTPPPTLPPNVRYRDTFLKPMPAGDIMWTTMFLDKETMFHESRRAGLWARRLLMKSPATTEMHRERPLMPLRKGHMGMLIAAGFLNNLTLENDEGGRVLVKGKTVKKMEMVDEAETSDIYREKMYTSVLALDLNSGEMLDVV